MYVAYLTNVVLLKLYIHICKITRNTFQIFCHVKDNCYERLCEWILNQNNKNIGEFDRESLCNVLVAKMR